MYEKFIKPDTGHISRHEFVNVITQALPDFMTAEARAHGVKNVFLNIEPNEPYKIHFKHDDLTIAVIVHEFVGDVTCSYQCIIMRDEKSEAVNHVQAAGYGFSKGNSFDSFDIRKIDKTFDDIHQQIDEAFKNYYHSKQNKKNPQSQC